MPMSRRMQQAVRAPSWWEGLTNVVAVYQPKGASSLSASYTNLSNPGTNDATVASGTPNWTTNRGWIGNGFALTTGWIPPNEQITVIVRYANTGGGTMSFFGVYPTHAMYLYASNGGQISYNNAGQVLVSPGLTTGVVAISGKSGYRNGVFDSTLAAGTQSGVNELWLMAINFDGAILQPETGDLMAVAICSTVQTAGQIATASSRMAGL